MNFEDIETASEEKDLGVTFQQDLKFSSHIAEKVNKANSTLSLIVRTFDYIEKDSFILLYKRVWMGGGGSGTVNLVLVRTLE